MLEPFVIVRSFSVEEGRKARAVLPEDLVAQVDWLEQQNQNFQVVLTAGPKRQMRMRPLSEVEEARKVISSARQAGLKEAILDYARFWGGAWPATIRIEKGGRYRIYFPVSPIDLGFAPKQGEEAYIIACLGIVEIWRKSLWSDNLPLSADELPDYEDRLRKFF